MKRILAIAIIISMCVDLSGAEILPAGVSYDSTITTPQDHFGFQPGGRHVLHYQLIGYMRLLASQSDRMEWMEYGESHGHRSLGQLVISSPDNISRLEDIRQRQLDLANPGVSSNLQPGKMPVVVNLNYSVHGNEASGANAAPLVAYYLAAATGPEIEKLLDSMVILLDPVLNPDGLDRFANWTNNNAGKVPNADPNNREHVESWPNGRTNYYWFDLNRDWMLLTQPESRGRLVQYHRWLPNLVLDFHEMGTNETYFFQPGVHARTHPLIPDNVFDLTKRISGYFSSALDEKNAPYFTEERFDDFYMGKGSTISDLKGAIGILFEQASARGILQDSDNGPVTFEYAISNQVTISLAVLKGAHEMRKDLLEHTRDFYADSVKIASSQSFAGYRFSAVEDPARADYLAGILHGHAIDAYPIEDGKAWFVPIRQPQYRYIEALFEQRTEFEESTFYDITAWTLPLALNLEVTPLKRIPSRKVAKSQPPEELGHSRLGYVFPWTSLHAPRLLFDLLEIGVDAKVARKPFTMDGQSYGYGSIFVPLRGQQEQAAEIHALLENAMVEFKVPVQAVPSFRTEEGIDLGSGSLAAIDKPEILIMATRGVDTYSTGSIWHLLDVYNDYPVTRVEPYQLLNMDLARYTALVMSGGSTSIYPAGLVDKLSHWIRQGGTLICLGNAISWAMSNNMVSLEHKKPGDVKQLERKPFASAADNRARQDIKGAIFEAEIDTSHPACYGYTGDHLPLFVKSADFLNLPANPYQAPLLFREDPLLAGYASSENLETMNNSAAVAVESMGKGSVIVFACDPTFRAYWRGTDKLLLNAMLFGKLMKP